jgi:hypothetical protein
LLYLQAKTDGVAKWKDMFPRLHTDMLTAWLDVLLFTDEPAADSEQYKDIRPFRLEVTDVSKHPRTHLQVPAGSVAIY